MYTSVKCGKEVVKITKNAFKKSTKVDFCLQIWLDEMDNTVYNILRTN